ncbi:MAG: hypothetical protein ACOVLB_04885 [Candidatus Nanopelagicus sp.]
MTNSTKLAITKAVLEQLSPKYNYDLEHAFKVWWVRSSGQGLRLTQLGDHCFQLAEIEFFEYPVDKALQITNWTQVLLDLTYKITCPYFIDAVKIKNPIIRVYDSQVAMMISLYGDLSEYINQTASKRK